MTTQNSANILDLTNFILRNNLTLPTDKIPVIRVLDRDPDPGFEIFADPEPRFDTFADLDQGKFFSINYCLFA